MPAPVTGLNSCWSTLARSVAGSRSISTALDSVSAAPMPCTFWNRRASSTEIALQA